MIVSPWAEVFLDGRSIGTTPIKAYPATVGRHRLRLVNAPLGRDERLRIRIRRATPLSVKRSW